MKRPIPVLSICQPPRIGSPAVHRSRRGAGAGFAVRAAPLRGAALCRRPRSSLAVRSGRHARSASEACSPRTRPAALGPLAADLLEGIGFEGRAMTRGLPPQAGGSQPRLGAWTGNGVLSRSGVGMSGALAAEAVPPCDTQTPRWREGRAGTSHGVSGSSSRGSFTEGPCECPEGSPGEGRAPQPRMPAERFPHQSGTGSPQLGTNEWCWGWDPRRGMFLDA